MSDCKTIDPSLLPSVNHFACISFGRCLGDFHFEKEVKRDQGSKGHNQHKEQITKYLFKMDTSTSTATAFTSRDNPSISVILNENARLQNSNNAAKDSAPAETSPVQVQEGAAETGTTSMPESSSSSISSSNSSLELKRMVTVDNNNNNNHHHHNLNHSSSSSSSSGTSNQKQQRSTATVTGKATANATPAAPAAEASPSSCIESTAHFNSDPKQQSRPSRPSPSSFEVMKKMRVLDQPLRPAEYSYQENINKASAALTLSTLFNAGKNSNGSKGSEENGCSNNSSNDGDGTDSNIDKGVQVQVQGGAGTVEIETSKVSTAASTTGDIAGSTSTAVATTTTGTGCDKSPSSTTSSVKGRSGIVSESDDDRVPSPSNAANSAARANVNVADSSVVDGDEYKLPQQPTKRQKIDVNRIGDHLTTSEMNNGCNYNCSSNDRKGSPNSMSMTMTMPGQDSTRGVSGTVAQPLPPHPPLNCNGRDMEGGANQHSSSFPMPSPPQFNTIDNAHGHTGHMNSSIASMTPTVNPNSHRPPMNFVQNQAQVHSQFGMTSSITTPLQQRRCSPTHFAHHDDGNNNGIDNGSIQGLSKTRRTINALHKYNHYTPSVKRDFTPICPRVNCNQQVMHHNTPLTNSRSRSSGSVSDGSRGGGGGSPPPFVASLANTLSKGHGSNSNFSKSDNTTGSSVNNQNANLPLGGGSNANSLDAKEAFTVTTHHHHHHGYVDGTVTPSPRHHQVPASARMGMNMNVMNMDPMNTNQMNMSMNSMHAAMSNSVPPSSTAANRASPTTTTLEQHHHHHHHHHHHVVNGVNGVVPPNPQFVTPAKCQSMNHHNHHVDMPTSMKNLEFTPNTTGNVNPFVDRVAHSAFKNPSMSSNGHSIINTVAPSTNNNGSYNRKDKSLGLLCENFIKKYSQHFADKVKEMESGSQPPALSIDEAAKSLGVERRRIYDIINILEAIRVVSRKCKNMYYWYGLDELTETFKCLQSDGFVNFKEDAIKNGFLPNDDSAQSVQDPSAQNEQQKPMTDPNSGEQTENSPNFERPDMPSGLAMLLASAEQVQIRSKNKVSPDINLKKINSQNAKEKSLAKLSQKFIQLFLVGNEVIAMNDASDKILGPTLAQSPDDVESKEEKAKIRAANSKLLKTKIRRLYDVANVLVSIGIIQKLNGGNNMSNALKHRPSFRWVYKVAPLELLKLQGRSG